MAISRFSPPENPTFEEGSKALGISSCLAAFSFSFRALAVSAILSAPPVGGGGKDVLRNAGAASCVGVYAAP